MITKIKTSRVFLFNPVATEVVSVEILGNPSIDALKASIKNAVLNYQILNSRILHDADGEYYFVPREDYKEPYIEVRNDVQTSEELINEQNRKIFDLENGDYQRYILIQKEDFLEMNIVQHHIVGDGMSIFMLVDKIMQNLKTIDEQNGDLTLEIPKMKPIQPLTRAHIEEYVQLNDLLKVTIENFNNKWREEEKVFSKDDFEKLSKEYWSKNHVNVRRELIEKEDMKYIINKCHEMGVTVNSLIYALAAKAFGEKTKMGFVVNVRGSKFSSYGNYVNSLIFDGEYDETKEFSENARNMHNLIKYNNSDVSIPLLGSLITNEVNGNLIDAAYFRNMKDYRSKVVSDYSEALGLGDEKIPFLASNLGVAKLESEYGRYVVQNIYVGSPLDSSLNLNMGVVTVSGNMSINVEYRNVEGVDYDDIIDQIMEGLNEIICELKYDEENEELFEFV